MKMKVVFFAAVFVLLLPFVSAFDCSYASDEAYCNDIIDSDLNITEKDLLLSSLFYEDSTFPNHELIEEYNLDITIDKPPNNTTQYNSTTIKNAWMSFLAMFPSVYEGDTLYVPSETNALCAYDYEVYVPEDYEASSYPETNQGDCKRTYVLIQNEAEIKHSLNEIPKGSGELALLNIDDDGTLQAELEINTNLRVKDYHWYTYCCKWKKSVCKKYCHECRYHATNYEPDTIIITEEKEVDLYTLEPTADITFVNQYYNTTKGYFTAANYSFFELSFNASFITEQNYAYDVIFDKKPYDIAYLNARNFSRVTLKNLYLTNYTFFVKNADECSLFAYNHFSNFSASCDMSVEQEEVSVLEMEERDIDPSLLLYTLTFLLFVYVLYKLAKSQFKKITLCLLLLLVIAAPFVAAAEEEDEDCGLTNLASCLPEKMYEYLLVVINAPLLPLLALVETLLTADVSIEIFHHVWSVMRYILSFFYLFFFVYSGYIFLTSNANPIRRAQAKDMLRNTFLMIILIQGSFYIYDLVLSISTTLTSTILSTINPHFFLLTADNIVNIGLEMLFSMAYAITLLVTVIMLVLRYLMASFGVVLFPIGLFCYFIPPLKGYGKFIINLLGIFIFITFIDLLIILACSMLIEAPLFANFKIIVMITCFATINYTLWLAIKFALKKSTNVSIKDDISRAVKYVALLA